MIFRRFDDKKVIFWYNIKSSNEKHNLYVKIIYNDFAPRNKSLRLFLWNNYILLSTDSKFDALISDDFDYLFSNTINLLKYGELILTDNKKGWVLKMK